MIDDKIKSIRDFCKPLVGCTIDRFETAEILQDDGSWDDWPDLPVRIHFTDQRLLSISWSGFDDLWLASDTSVPFEAEDTTTRWRTGLPEFDAAIGHKVHGAMLGRGEMTVESRDIEIWTRLLFDLGGMWLEVFNALDENGYNLHETKPDGEFRTCI